MEVSELLDLSCFCQGSRPPRWISCCCFLLVHNLMLNGWQVKDYIVKDIYPHKELLKPVRIKAWETPRLGYFPWLCERWIGFSCSSESLSSVIFNLTGTFLIGWHCCSGLYLKVLCRKLAETSIDQCNEDILPCLHGMWITLFPSLCWTGIKMWELQQW